MKPVLITLSLLALATFADDQPRTAEHATRNLEAAPGRFQLFSANHQEVVASLSGTITNTTRTTLFRIDTATGQVSRYQSMLWLGTLSEGWIPIPETYTPNFRAATNLPPTKP